jgi:hypothetical protein
VSGGRGREHLLLAGLRVQLRLRRQVLLLSVVRRGGARCAARGVHLHRLRLRPLLRGRVAAGQQLLLLVAAGPVHARHAGLQHRRLGEGVGGRVLRLARRRVLVGPLGAAAVGGGRLGGLQDPAVLQRLVGRHALRGVPPAQ